MSKLLQYYYGAERPTAKLWLIDDDGDLIDFSTAGYAFEFKVGVPESTLLLTKTSGITGAVGAGHEPDGDPNVTITWVANDLAFATGNYWWFLKATIAGLDRLFSGPFELLPVA